VKGGRGKGIVVSEKQRAHFTQFSEIKDWEFVTLVDGDPEVIRRTPAPNTRLAVNTPEEIVWGLLRQLGEVLASNLYELI
jgi:hypothetical protein